MDIVTGMDTVMVMGTAMDMMTTIIVMALVILVEVKMCLRTSLFLNITSQQNKHLSCLSLLSLVGEGAMGQQGLAVRGISMIRGDRSQAISRVVKIIIKVKQVMVRDTLILNTIR